MNNKYMFNNRQVLYTKGSAITEEQALKLVEIHIMPLLEGLEKTNAYNCETQDNYEITNGMDSSGGLGYSIDELKKHPLTEETIKLHATKIQRILSLNKDVKVMVRVYPKVYENSVYTRLIVQKIDGTDFKRALKEWYYALEEMNNLGDEEFANVLKKYGYSLEDIGI
jgi:hypothetical protein